MSPLYAIQKERARRNCRSQHWRHQSNPIPFVWRTRVTFISKCISHSLHYGFTVFDFSLVRHKSGNAEKIYIVLFSGVIFAQLFVVLHPYELKHLVVGTDHLAVFVFERGPLFDSVLLPLLVPSGVSHLPLLPSGSSAGTRAFASPPPRIPSGN